MLTRFFSGKNVLRASISASSSGDNTIVSAVSGKKIQILGMVLFAAGDVDVTIKDGASTSLSGAMSLATDGNGFVLPLTHKAIPWNETSSGNALVLNLSGAVAVAGFLIYSTK